MKHLMIVDDDPILVFLIKKIFEQDSDAYTFIDAENGQIAINYLENPLSIRPDLILLDINMPIMDGWQFLEQFERYLKTNQLEIPVMIISSSIDPNDIEKSKQFSSVLNFLSKPFTRSHIEEIKQLLPMKA